MKKLFRKTTKLFLLVAILFVSVLPVSAADDPYIGLSPSGNLFAKMEEMMPGDTVTEYIVISNKYGELGGFFITPEDTSLDDFSTQLEMEQSERLLEQLTLKLVRYQVDADGIVADSGVEVYNGKADGSTPHTSKQYAPHWKGSMFLGEVGGGGNIVIGATLHASETIDNDYEHTQAKFKWTISFQKWVERLYEDGDNVADIPPHLWGKDKEEKNKIPSEEIIEHESIIVLSGKPTVLPLPQTGGGSRGNTGPFLLLGVLLLILLLVLVLVINKPRKKLK